MMRRVGFVVPVVFVSLAARLFAQAPVEDAAAPGATPEGAAQHPEDRLGLL